MKFVNTGFNIQTSLESMDGDKKIMERIEMCTNEHSSLCFSKKTSKISDENTHFACSGILFRTCTELDILELQRINYELEQK